MTEKQKPQADIVSVAARAMKHPENVSHEDIKRMASRILDDQENSPDPNKTKNRTDEIVDKIRELHSRPLPYPPGEKD